MADLFENNSYKILGLDTTASRKDILKRKTDLINFCKINEEILFSTDILFENTARNEDLVKRAFNNLSIPEKRIKEVFFWFRISDDVDENALICLKNTDYHRAYSIWEEGITKFPLNSFHYAKNLAVLFSILFMRYNETDLLHSSLKYWRNLFTNEENWRRYLKEYSIIDDLHTNPEILRKFKDKVLVELADFYAEISEKYKNPEYYKEFFAIFHVKGSRIKNKVIIPIFEAIREKISNIEQIRQKDLRFFKNYGYQLIKDDIKKIDEFFLVIKKIGFYGEGEVKMFRDECAERMRDVSIFINNEFESYEEAYQLLEYALQIAGTDSLGEKIYREFVQVASHKTYYEILDIIRKGDITRAKKLIEIELSKNNLPVGLRNSYEEMYLSLR